MLGPALWQLGSVPCQVLPIASGTVKHNRLVGLLMYGCLQAVIREVSPHSITFAKVTFPATMGTNYTLTSTTNPNDRLGFSVQAVRRQAGRAQVLVQAHACLHWCCHVPVAGQRGSRRLASAAAVPQSIAMAWLLVPGPSCPCARLCHGDESMRGENAGGVGWGVQPVRP